MIDKERAITLLNATMELLKKQMYSPCVFENILDEPIFYDEEEKDGYCLYEDISCLLKEMEKADD